MYIISILAIITLAHFIRNISGPFGIFSLLRNLILRNKYIGTFFYKLLSCPFCTGTYCGILIYILQCDHLDIRQFILWSLAGSAIVALTDPILEKLNIDL
jgi:hypothetical protein